MFRRVVIARVFDDALANFEGEVQAAKGGVALFKIFDDAQRVQVVVKEKAMVAHGRVERLFSGVAEWGMAEVMHQRERFRQIYIKGECASDSAGDLRHFDSVGETVTEVVGITAGENLCFIFKAAKGAGVDDAVTVALIIVAIRMRRFREAASAGIFCMHRVAGQHAGSLTGGSSEVRVSSTEAAPQGLKPFNFMGSAWHG